MKDAETIIDIYYMTAKIPGEQTESIFKKVTLPQIKEKIEKSYLIDKIKLLVTKQEKIIFDGLITREGFCSFYHGDFSFFNEKIINPVLKVSRGRLKLFSDLIKIEPESEIVSQPIELEFKRELDIKSLRNLSSVIQKIDTLSVSVIHEGNPMLLIHAIDREDGSAFDITAVGKSVFLTPVFETSGSSLLKTSEYISRWFEEPTIRRHHSGGGKNEFDRDVRC
jgi:hypothetical protein